MNTTVISAEASSKLKIKGLRFIKSFMGIDEYQLENGLKILLKPNKNVPLFSWQVWYKVGSRNESIGLTGIAHYLEHIMFKGTKTFGKGEISQIIQLKGGVFNAFTSDDYTAYFENFAPENLELAIKIEADRMQNSRIDKDEVELERSVIVSELEGNRNDPNNILYETMKSTAYQVHSYRNPVIGWRDDLDNINSENMREFYETYYYPDNAVAILVGNFDSDEALFLIQKYFGQYKPKQNYRHKITKEPEQNAEKRVVIKNGGYVKLLGIAFHIPEFNHADSPALSVLGDVMFNGMSSRLYPKLVDKGLATDISGVPEPNLDAGIFRVIVNLNPDADIKEVEKIINKEFDAVKEGISEEELKLAKAREEASFIYQRDGVYEEGLQIGYFEAISGDWTKYGTWTELIGKVTNEDIKRVAKTYFKPDNKTTVYSIPETAEEMLIDPNALPETNCKELETVFASKTEANYGSATIEPINPKKLSKLLKISGPKYSKGVKHSKIDLAFNQIDSGIQGLNILHREDHSLPIVYLNADFYAGATANPPEKLGLAFFTAKMLSRGSTSKDKYEISRLLDLYGADLSFEATKEGARIHVSTLTKYLPEVYAILQEILKSPKFDAEELKRLKIQTIAQIKQEDEFPRQVVSREIKQLIYPKGHPYYSYSAEDRIKAIESISIDDIKGFYQQNYNPKNLFVTIVGDIDQYQGKKLALDTFADWNKAENIYGNNEPVIPLVESVLVQEKSITMEDKEQTEIVMGHSGNVNRLHQDFYPLLMANYVLGGSALSSRMGTVVRDENGLVYNIRSSFAGTLGAGDFNIVLGCNPKNTTKAIELTKGVIKDFLKTGVNDTELKVTKSYLVGSFASRTLSSNEEILETLSQLQFYKLGNNYIKTYEDMVNSITLEQVNEAARKHIKPEKLNTVIVGPKYQ